MTIDQISIFVENKPGRLVEAIETLGAKGIDLRAMSIADTSDFGILRLIVDHPERALEILREAEYVTSVNKVIAVSIADAPGGLAKVLRILSDTGIGVEYVYAFITHEADKAYVILRVEDNEGAVDALTSNGITIASSQDLYNL